jgi:Uncharacterized alpha/beta hydrolase domain (DUF2235)
MRILHRLKLSDSRLALNEKRGPFTPTLWIKPFTSHTMLKQVWFPGTHSAIGGGQVENRYLSNIALFWMIEQIHVHTKLEIDMAYLKNNDFVKVTTDKPWGCADYSGAGILALAGIVPRIPKKKDPQSCETLHKSVEARMKYYHGKAKLWSHPNIDGMQYDVLGQIEEEMKKIFYPSGQH